MNQVEFGSRWLRTLRVVSSSVFIRKCVKRIGAALSFAIVGMFLASDVSLAQEFLVGCTPGELQCQVDEESVCTCYDEWRVIDGRESMVTVCGWESTGRLCGRQTPPPACTPDYEGATHQFPDYIKECKCYEGNCRWY